jgi:hypothetical protein
MPQADVLTRLQSRLADELRAITPDESGQVGFRPDSAAWAVLACWDAPGMREVVQPLARKLLEAQSADGRVVIDPRFPHSAWPTPLAVLAWLEQEEEGGSVTRAVQFLLQWHGLHWPNTEPDVMGHDTSIVGWPWVTSTHSWIEPTSLTLLALGAAGKSNESRVAQARKMILNRQIASGGWNYGNTMVYGQNLRPMVHSTGMALAALAAGVNESEIARSIQYLEKALPAIRAPLSLGWGIIGLTAWNRRPPEAEQWINECLQKEDDLVEYNISLLGVLRCALFSKQENPLLRGMKQ